MSFLDLVDQMLRDTLKRSLWAFQPELALCATIVLILLARILLPRWRSGAYWVAFTGTAAALFLAAPWHYLAGGAADRFGPIFTGMLVFDGFAVYMRGLILAFVLLLVVLTRIARTVEPIETIELYVLVLGATLGMCLMVSANHMLIVFLGIEMASVPSYVLAALLKHRRQSAEAALKFAVFGAATAGVMLYGISLLCGVLGSAQLPAMAVELARFLDAGGGRDGVMVLVLAGLMIAVGLAFKLSAVPFHQWAPDVFEGATAEVAAFLSVASKAAAVALLVRLALGFACLQQPPGLAADRAAAGIPLVVPQTEDNTLRATAGLPSSAQNTVGQANRATAGLPSSAQNTVGQANRGTRQLEPGVQPTAAAPAAETTLERLKQLEESIERLRELERQLPPEALAELPRPSRLEAALRPARKYIAGLVALLAAVTCTFGNLAAYGQSNIKRLLAYSTIAHAGYMMMAVAAAVTLCGSDAAGARAAVAALAFYLGVYLFMNLGMFAAVAFLRDALGSEQIDSYARLIRRSPGLAVCLAILLFSLIGLPPFAGFPAKFTVFAALLNAGLLGLLAIGAANTVLSLFYYLRVVKVIVLERQAPEQPAAGIPLASPPGAFCLAVTLPVVVLGIWWAGLFRWAEAAASSWPF